jgi:hypothetical protein
MFRVHPHGSDCATGLLPAHAGPCLLLLLLLLAPSASAHTRTRAPSPPRPASPLLQRARLYLPLARRRSPPHLTITHHHPALPALRRRRVVPCAALKHRSFLESPIDPVVARLLPVSVARFTAASPSPGPSSDRDCRKEQSTPPVPRPHRYFATRARHGLLLFQPQPHGFSQAFVDAESHGP